MAKSKQSTNQKMPMTNKQDMPMMPAAQMNKMMDKSVKKGKK